MINLNLKNDEIFQTYNLNMFAKFKIEDTKINYKQNRNDNIIV